MDNFDNNKNAGNEDDYSFLTETIKKRPRFRKQTLRHIRLILGVCILAAAALFLCVKLIMKKRSGDPAGGVEYVSSAESDAADSLSEISFLSYAGITGRVVSAEKSRETGVPEGIYIEEIEPESPALLAGLSVGDVITRVFSEEVRNAEQLSRILADADKGGNVPVTVLREGADGYVEFGFEIEYEE